MISDILLDQKVVILKGLLTSYKNSVYKKVKMTFFFYRNENDSSFFRRIFVGQLARNDFSGPHCMANIVTNCLDREIIQMFYIKLSFNWKAT